MSASRPRKFQYVLAVLGTFIFLLNMQLVEWLNEHGYLYAGQLLVGYDLGFLLSFSLMVMLEIFRGNSYQFIDSGTFSKPLSYFCLLIIFAFSALGIWSTNYHSISYGYNTAYFIGTVICGFGLVPVISYHDR